MPSETIYDLGSGHGPRADRLLFKLWARSASGDPDLSRDMRMMVPIGYDVERKRYKVWAIMGISKKPLVIDFVYPLRVKAIRDQSGGEVDQSRFKVGVEDEKHDLAYLVMAEVYVENLLNRAQFREHCDHHKTAEDILRHLR